MGPIFGLKYLDNQQGVTTFDIVMSFHILPLLILHLRTFITLTFLRAQPIMFASVPCFFLLARFERNLDTEFRIII